MKVLFLLPHPDDDAILCPVTIFRLVQAGHAVTLALATTDEYGTDRNAFKGERIRRIRMAEMYADANVYGVDAAGHLKVKIVWLGFIDGHLPLAPEALDRVLTLIRAERPTHVVSTDPYFPMDFHNDHLRIGQLTLLAYRRLAPDQRPPLYLTQSYRPTHYQPFPWRAAKVAWQAFGKHRSQITPLRFKLLNAARVLYFLLLRRRKAGRAAEGFRKVTSLTGPENYPRSLVEKMVYAFFAGGKFAEPGGDLFSPSPAELGLPAAHPVIVVDPAAPHVPERPSARGGTNDEGTNPARH